MKSTIKEQEINSINLLRKFKVLCDVCNNNDEEYLRIKRILNICDNQETTLISIFNNRYNVELDFDEVIEIKSLVKSYFSKSNVRKQIPSNKKEELLRKQENKCAICGTEITIHDHVDHIVPFLYVGDCLNDTNLQMLCSRCNKKKWANIDYQVK